MPEQNGHANPASPRSGDPDHAPQRGFGPDMPIAIVGMACRFPRAGDLDAFWHLLATGESAVEEGSPGSGIGRVGELFLDGDVQSEACRFGAYLEDIDQFDAGFFRISPIEAQLLDPQQRLMLETSWRALEDAGMDPDRLHGSRTGVYAGISNNEYRGLILDASDTAEPAASLYSVTGTSFNTAIGRVAFVLGLQGPAMAVDTACSSSLVAVHQAVTGLQRGESDLALAGGVHTILSGRLLELRGNAGMLAPDGRCKTFDASANGYVRGEGCGILVLKRLQEAEADGDRIWGVIRGTALNQDGASPGLTVPNGEAQVGVIEDALARAGVLPSQVDYVEAHGTGTPVGDPIELQATGSAYSSGRTADVPLLIGSVKTNFGHLESAAGAAGLIKVVLAMRKGVIPKHLNFRIPTPEVDWDQLPVKVTSEATEWPIHADRKPLAGVSGFGWSGTNAHVVVEGYESPDEDIQASSQGRWPAGSPQAIPVCLPDPAAAAPGPRATRLLPLSGKSGNVLPALAGRYLSWLDAHAAQLDLADSAADRLLADMAWTASTGRSHFAHRAALTFQDADSLREQLQVLADTNPDTNPRPGAKVAFAYTGQASQWVGMGQTLYEREPVARSILDRCDRILREERGTSLLAVMFGQASPEADLDDPAWTQPAIYALECALTALWRSVGIEPDAVVGHSLGEIAAAQAAGIFSLEDGLRFAAARGALMNSIPDDGAMAAVFASPAQVQEAVDARNAISDDPRLSIAADNGAQQVVTGPAAAVDAVVGQFEAEGLWVRKLRNSQAYHSALLEPVLGDLEAIVDTLAPSTVTGTFVSSMTGRVVAPGTTLGSEYWCRQTRQPVKFRTCIETLVDLGIQVVVELGPRAVLGPLMATNWPVAPEEPPAILSSLIRPTAEDRERGECDSGFVEAVGEAYTAGLPVHLEGLFVGEARRRIALPAYPFQRRRHWVETRRRRTSRTGHPLLGVRHESPRNEILFETEISASEPTWLEDHKVFGWLVAPGALYAAMAASAVGSGSNVSVTVEDLQLHNPLLVPAEDQGEEGGSSVRNVELVLDASGLPQAFEIFSRGEDEEEWTLHAEGRASSSAASRTGERIDPADLQDGLQEEDTAAFYRARAEAGVNLGPGFRTLRTLWSGTGEALGEIVLPESIGSGELTAHPLLLDGCLQVMAAARRMAGVEEGGTYLPFGWERLWLNTPLPDRMLCHARMRESARAAQPEDAGGEPPEVLAGDLRFYTPDGVELGGLNGYTVKRATRAALLSATEGVKDLLYEIVWRDRPLVPGILPADFLPCPTAVAAGSQPFTAYLSAEGVAAQSRADLLTDLERLSWAYALAALDTLGWTRKVGQVIDPDTLRQRLQVDEVHRKLFRRMLEMAARIGVLEEQPEGFVVTIGTGDPLPEAAVGDPVEFARWMETAYPHGTTEIGLFQRSAGALADVLRGLADPLTLLFSSGEPSAADLYLKAPVARAANRMLADAMVALLSEIPDGRRLRVLEVGAGTGSATASVLPELPEDRFDYVYTDISAGFFAEAESRFGGAEASIEYRVLDIEKDPVDQGFEEHAYDLVIASNVLHATRYLQETLAHCRMLLAPSGHLVALENLRGQGWLDLTFGQLDGWWRFADHYRLHHALAGPAVWRQALDDAGFRQTEVLGVAGADSAETPDRGVIMAQGPAEVAEAAGLWVLAADGGDAAEALAAALVARNQQVILAGRDWPLDDDSAVTGSGVTKASVEPGQRESWSSLFEELPDDVPFAGIIHLMSLDGHGAEATTQQLAEDTRLACASALALVQGLTDQDLLPGNGVWLVTRGAQVLEREGQGHLVGATLWGSGKVVAREAGHLQPRMLDLDPGAPVAFADLVDEFLYPDDEDHIAYRRGLRQASRLERTAVDSLSVSEESGWLLEPDVGGALEGLHAQPWPKRPLEAREVRVAVDATGLNFWDLFRALGVIDEGLLGGEFCGRILDVGSEVSAFAPGDLVVGLAFGTFGPETVTREEMVAPAPSGFPATSLATIPTAFVSAALSFDAAELKAGERVLIHAGAGGVELAAIQLAQAAGAEVFATASAPKQAYLRSLGVKHVFDSRRTKFGEQIREATGGEGVHVVLNSLTGEGFIDTSLSCLAQGGRFVEMARVDIFSEEEMAAARPDVAYTILELDVLKEFHPEVPGAALRKVMLQLAAGEVGPLVHSRWSLTEAGAAMDFMRGARHIGKIVLTPSPIERGSLRADRTYLVTGGLGGIGCAVAGWLADRGAGAIVLNGRREPDAPAREAISALQARGVTIRAELADVTDGAAVDAMLARMDASLPPLGGVIHSVGVLSDAALTNQTWQSFEDVLWPKMLGAWHLHRATADRGLDLFVLFSSVTGVLGNAGQANHGAANAFLDQLAGHRRAQGLAGQSIAWGAWAGLGEAEEQRERIAGQLEASGTGWISPRQGLRAFERLVHKGTATGMVASVDWSILAEHIGRPAPLLESLLATEDEVPAEQGDVQADLLSGLSLALPEAREQVLVSFLQNELQAVMRLPNLPPPVAEFSDLGMDSLMAVELRNRLNRAFAGEYVASNTVVFDFPSIAELARHLAGEFGDAPEPTPRQAPVTPRALPEEDAIAIVGMACRFPGAEDLAAFWELLATGANAVTDGRTDSGDWQGVAGDPDSDDAASRRGAFVDGIDRFDAGFFRIAPIEARTMDPQQRMLLETSWQALEDAGIDPDQLKGSRSGVYMGVGASEYRRLMEAKGADGDFFGTAGSVAVGRIAFTLGLEGPAVPFDLACTSSLVAVHQAVASLQRGDADLALAGGVNAILFPKVARFLADLGMLSQSGQCWSFDAAADGYVRGEGCGVVVLKPLSRAEADGDRVWAVIRGSAVNQNGAGLGLTLPSGPAQERVMTEALMRAGVDPAEVDYLEAHGPGNAVGDEVELSAAATVYGPGRGTGQPLLVGSVKTNMGHLESAGAIAGLIKTVLAMRHGTIPKHLHFNNPTPEVDWRRMPLQVTSESTDWPSAPGRPFLAGVNAFGISGSNVHVVVEGYEGRDGGSGRDSVQCWPEGSVRTVGASLPEETTDFLPEGVAGSRAVRLLPLSGRTPKALGELAGRYLVWLDQHAEELAGDGSASDALISNLAWTAGVGRSHFTYRAGVVFRDGPSLREQLQVLRDNPEGIGQPGSRPVTNVAFLYGGLGSPWVGMGAALYESEPVARAVLDYCDSVFWEEQSVSLLDTVFGRTGASGDLDDPAWGVPALYAMESALTALWSALSIRPSVVLGHGPGALVAAQQAGAFGMKEGLQLAMACGTRLSELQGQKEGEPFLSGFEASLADAASAPPSPTLVSHVTGRVVAADDRLDGAFWHRQMSEPAALDACVGTLAGLEVDAIVEIGPDSVLGPQEALAWPDASGTPGCVRVPFAVRSREHSATHGRSAEEGIGFAEAVAKAYEAGLPVAFAGMFAGEQRRRISLPGYPFQRRRYWF